MSDLFDPPAVTSLEHDIDRWLAGFAASNPVIVAIDRDDSDEIRWYVRMSGEEKEFITVWLALGQRTLKYEAYVMAAPEENAQALYEHVLRRNDRLVGVHFSIGVEDALFLRGQLPLGAVSEDELDRVIGSLYVTIEQCYKTLLRVGFASRFPK